MARWSVVGWAFFALSIASLVGQSNPINTATPLIISVIFFSTSDIIGEIRKIGK